MRVAAVAGPKRRLALVPGKRHEPRMRAAWQRCLGTIDPGPERAADARDVHWGVVLHQQLAALPTGAAKVWAAVAVLRLGADRARHGCIIRRRESDTARPSPGGRGEGSGAPGQASKAKTTPRSFERLVVWCTGDPHSAPIRSRR